MKINHKNLRQLVKDGSADVQALGQAVSRPGLSGESAVRAVRNWVDGRDHPRAGANDIRALAGALQVDPRSIASFESMSRFVRTSPRKARLVADMIRGQRYDQAEDALRFNKRRAAYMMLKTLRSAYAQAEEAGIDPATLFVTTCRVDQGATIKRFRPKDRGRSHPIQKKTSHIVVALEEVA